MSEEASALVLSVFLTVPLTGTVLVSNSCIFAAYCRNSKLRTVDNYLVMCLTLANLAVGLCYPLQGLVDVGILNEPLVCLPLACLLLVFAFVIAWTIVGLTVERYLNILHPFAVRRILTERRVLCIISGIMLYAVVTGAVVPPIISARSNTSPEEAVNGTASELGRCRFVNLVPSSVYRLFYLANRVVAIPFFFGIYLRIFLVARRHMRAIGSQVVPAGPSSQEGPSNHLNTISGNAESDIRPQRSERHSSRSRWRREIRLTLLVCVIAIYQSICWIPQTLLFMLKGDKVSTSMYIITHFFTYSSTGIYPIIYGLGNRDFRTALANLFGCTNKAIKPSTGAERVSTSPKVECISGPANPPNDESDG